PLAAADLERLAVAAYLLGRDDEYLQGLDRAHQAYQALAEHARAARCAFWLGLRLLFRGEGAQANGWLCRAERLLEHAAADCVERGYLLLPVAQQRLSAGDCESAYDAALRAAAIGERFAEPDLVATAVHLQGRARIEQGKVGEGLSLLDEAMIAVVGHELSPIVTGLIYCSVIEGCHDVHAVDRAHEWTAALGRWCELQPEMIAFTGVCRVHRAELLQLRGDWTQAFDEAQRARERCAGNNTNAAGAASYQQGEVHRLRGEFAAAELAYGEASRCGWEPQPGLSLLRLAQGRGPAAAAAIRRMLAASARPAERTRLLPACVEIMLALGELPEAERAGSELEQLAERLDTRVVSAHAAYARGAIELALGHAQVAIPLLRSALRCWQEMQAPRQAAQARALLASCYRAFGDEEGAELELAAARSAFEQLGAKPDLVRLEARAAAPQSVRPQSVRPHGLTARELEVLRWVSTGQSNKQISTQLFLSEKTIERHLSNIFAKLGVDSRAGATAYAYKHALVE
ncbi:MAG TPA: LuxR C-terminal-related transcriptional regulator, partial [Polyangiales bacterium]|nr:LuxR C-terminal-related transcriptional regulator [Polyangiales bacterium]